MTLKLYARDGGAVPPALLQGAVDDRARTAATAGAVDDAVISQMALLALGDETLPASSKNVLCAVVDSSSAPP